MYKTRHCCALLLPAILAACASVPPAASYRQAGQVRTVEIGAVAGTPVRVVFAAGELDVVGVDGESLDAELIIRCPEANESCLKRAEKVTLGSSMSGDGLRVEVDNAPLLRRARAELKLRVRLPAENDLYVDFGYGELNLRDMRGCVTVDMSAGDATLRLPLASIRSVTLDAGVGDASLRTPDGPVPEHRSWLVGAEVEWHDGPGRCHLDVDLNAGEISVRLEND